MTALIALVAALNLAGLDDGRANRVSVSTGAEYAFIASIGYARAVPFAGRTVLLGGEVTIPWGGLDLKDYRARASALIPIAGADRWRIAGSVAPTVRGTANDTGRMTSLGVDFGALGGYYAPHWFAGAEAGFDWAITSYIAHSDEYRRVVYSGVRDGWYANPGGNFRLGVQGGASFGRHDLVLRAGRLADAGLKAPAIPFYATLAIDTRW